LFLGVCFGFLKREAGDEDDKKKGNGKSSVSNRRSRAAAVHNQSERVCPLLSPGKMFLQLEVKSNG
jgi:hypothetical protein